MSLSAGDTTKQSMASARLILEKDIDAQLQKIESFTAVPFRRSMDSLVERAQTTAQSQVDLAKMKAKLREAEDELVRVLAVKARKEARELGIKDSISATKSRVEMLRRNLQLQRSEKDEYMTFISQQLQAIAMSKKQDDNIVEDKGDIQEAISWYNHALGFHVECGHGVKFKFNNIDANNPNHEYSFTVHYGNNIYTLLDCNPPLNDIKEQVQELNDTNDLFRFVRLMREKFVKATLLGMTKDSENVKQESTAISASTPMVGFENDAGLVTPESKASQDVDEGNQKQKRGRHNLRSKSPIETPLSSRRRSSRLKAKK